MKRWITIISCLLCLSCILALCSCSCKRDHNDDGNVTPTGTNAELDAPSSGTPKTTTVT